MNDFTQAMRCFLAVVLTTYLLACGGGEDTAPGGTDEAGGSDVADTTGSVDAAPDSDTPTTPSTDVTGKMLDEMASLTQVLKGVKDEASAKAAADYIMGYAERKEALAEAFKSLTTAEQVASSQKHVKRNMDVNMALHKEMMRINLDPELKKHLADAFDKLK